MLAVAIAVPAWAGAAQDKALLEAAFSLDIEGVKAALAKGADPNAKKFERSPEGATLSKPALLSAIFGQLPKSAPKASRTPIGREELQKFVGERKAAIAKLLFDGGAKLDNLDSISRSLLFSFAIEEGNLALQR
jgi:hypothetical protein